MSMRASISASSSSAMAAASLGSLLTLASGRLSNEDLFNLGLLLRKFFDLQPIYGLVIGGVSMVIAGFLTLLVDKEAEPQ